MENQAHPMLSAETLYGRTGDIRDVNTLLVNRQELRQALAAHGCEQAGSQGTVAQLRAQALALVARMNDACFGTTERHGAEKELLRAINSLAALAEKSAPEESARIDWLQRAGDVGISMLQDQPRDGEYCVTHDLGGAGIGPSLRAAIDDARGKTGVQRVAHSLAVSVAMGQGVTREQAEELAAQAVQLAAGKVAPASPQAQSHARLLEMHADNVQGDMRAEIAATMRAAGRFLRQPVPSVPAGHVLVPVEPTRAMHDVMLTWGTKRSEWMALLVAAAEGAAAQVGEPGHDEHGGSDGC